MSYEIIIREKREVKRVVGRRWAVVGKKEVAREPSFIREGGPDTIMEDVYGYTPEVESTEPEEREVLKQSVDTLDLPKVIRAINYLE